MLADPATLDDGKNFSLRMALAQYLNPNARVGCSSVAVATSLLAWPKSGRGEQRTTRPLRAGVMEHAAQVSSWTRVD